MRRLILTLRMVAAYRGRFPRRKVIKLYWRIAGDMTEDTNDAVGRP